MCPQPRCSKNAALKGIIIGSRAQQQDMIAAIDDGIKPVIDSTFALDHGGCLPSQNLKTLWQKCIAIYTMWLALLKRPEQLSGKRIMAQPASTVPPLNLASVAVIEGVGRHSSTQSVGAVEGLDLAASTPPPEPVVEALEHVMAERACGFRSHQPCRSRLSAGQLLVGRQNAAQHPQRAPGHAGRQPNLFRLSNDTATGFSLGQWHNDGSFNLDTFLMPVITWCAGSSTRRHLPPTAAFDAHPRAAELLETFVLGQFTSGVVHPSCTNTPSPNANAFGCIWA